MDFHLFNFAKHFIVGPSSFHWWAAWLNANKEKICVRPPNFIKPTNNIKEQKQVENLKTKFDELFAN